MGIEETLIQPFYPNFLYSKTINVISFEMHRNEEVLQIKLENTLVAGSDVLLKIEYVGFINDKMSGFYRSSYEDLKSGEKK